MAWLSEHVVRRVLEGEWDAVGLPPPYYHYRSRQVMRLRYSIRLRERGLEHWSDPVEIAEALDFEVRFNSKIPVCACDGTVILVPPRVWAFSAEFPLLVLHEMCHGLMRRQHCHQATETDAILMTGALAVPEHCRKEPYLSRFDLPRWYLGLMTSKYLIP